MLDIYGDGLFLRGIGGRRRGGRTGIEAQLRATAISRLGEPSGNVVYCSPYATGTGDGSTWADACTTWQAAFAAAADGDTVLFDAPAETPFPPQRVEDTVGVKQRLRIRFDAGPSGTTQIDGRTKAEWTDNGSGIWSIALADNPRAVGYDVKQDDLAGTVTGVDWTEPKYARAAARQGRDVNRLRAWYNLLREAAVATTSPAEGEWSHTGGRLYINPPGSPDAATVAALACYQAGHGIDIAAWLYDCYFYGDHEVIFTPNYAGGGGYGIRLPRAVRCTWADAWTHMSGYHAIGTVSESGEGNRFLCCTANGMTSNDQALIANAFVFYQESADLLNSGYWGHDMFFAAYPCLDTTGAPILKQSGYAPTLGLSHTNGVYLTRGVKWTYPAQVDFIDQISKKSGASFSQTGSFIGANDTGDTTDVLDPTPWGAEVSNGYTLGRAGWIQDGTDHVGGDIDRDNRGSPIEFVTTMSSGGSGNKRFRMRGGSLSTGAASNVFGPSSIGDRILLQGVTIDLQQGSLYQPNSADPENPGLIMGGCVVKATSTLGGLLTSGTTPFTAGTALSFQSLGGNVFETGMRGELRAGWPSVASYERSLETVLAAVDPLGLDTQGVEMRRWSETELLANGGFPSDLSSWNDTTGNWAWSAGGDGGSALLASTLPGVLWQNIDIDEGDLLAVDIDFTRGSSTPISAAFYTADNAAAGLGASALLSQQAASGLVSYRVRVNAGWGCIRIGRTGTSSGDIRLNRVSVRKLVLLD